MRKRNCNFRFRGKKAKYSKNTFSGKLTIFKEKVTAFLDSGDQITYEYTLKNCYFISQNRR